MRTAALVRSLPPSGIRRFFDIVAQMEDVISLGVGEPDFVTPWRIREAAIYSVERGLTQYTGNTGLPELRSLISRYLEETWGLGYSAEDEILVTVGVSEALDLALRSLLNPGDEVLIPEPCYVSYQPCTVLAGGTPVPLPGRPENGFAVDPRQVEAAITPRTRALILSYPTNPTGTTLRPPLLQELARVAGRHDLAVISDEIYAELTYGPAHVAFASLPGMRDRTLTLNGFSKAFAMTGWRIAYAAGPAEWIEGMTRIHQYTMLCAPMPSQQAAAEALRGGRGEIEEMIVEYRERGLFLAGQFRQLGLACPDPEGAFYLFPRIAGVGLDCESFAEQLLRQERVAVVPGTAFGECGEGHVRCSYATGMPQLQEAVRRLERFLEQARRSSEAGKAPAGAGRLAAGRQA